MQGNSKLNCVSTLIFLHRDMFYIQSLHARVEQSADDETPYLINKIFLSREGIVDKSEVKVAPYGFVQLQPDL